MAASCHFCQVQFEAGQIIEHWRGYPIHPNCRIFLDESDESESGMYTDESESDEPAPKAKAKAKPKGKAKAKAKAGNR